MNGSDQIAALNEKHWTRAVQEGAGCTVPWLDLDPAVVRAYAGGTLENPAGPLYQIYPAHVLSEAQNKDVLCLASGGGQQSALFGLLGARVTVLDLTEAQLNGDRAAAAHYGYNLTTIRGDMRDLSCLADTAFDLVYQGHAMGWVPDVQPIYRGLARVLRPDGIYRVDFSNPATEFVDWNTWDGTGYRLTVPYAITERVERFESGEAQCIQFRHSMSYIFNGLIEMGLSIEHVHDAPDYFRRNEGAEPGGWDHWLTYVGGFAVVARKR